jgi:hypothetical protein
MLRVELLSAGPNSLAGRVVAEVPA